MAIIGPNSGLAIATRVLGQRLDPYLSCNFVVEIEGILAGGFAECSGLQVETEIFEYREGGRNEFMHRFAGPTRHPPLVFKHGLTPIDGLWDWHQDVVAGRIKRHNGTIFLLNAQGIPVRWWHFNEALPIKWTGPDMQASAAAVAFESVEIAHRGLSRPQLQTLATDIADEFTASLNGSGSFF